MALDDRCLPHQHALVPCPTCMQSHAASHTHAFSGRMLAIVILESFCLRRECTMGRSLARFLTAGSCRQCGSWCGQTTDAPAPQMKKCCSSWMRRQVCGSGPKPGQPVCRLGLMGAGAACRKQVHARRALGDGGCLHRPSIGLLCQVHKRYCPISGLPRM
jgi:hypothetical protein